MLSPRPSCEASSLNATTCPPNCRIPTSNDTRVRVEGFSKIIASVRPASRWVACLRERLIDNPRSRIRLSVVSSSRSMSRKCLGAVISRRFCRKLRASVLDDAARLLDLPLADDQRGQQAHHVVARGNGQQTSFEQLADHGPVADYAFQPEHQTHAADFGDHPGEP